MFSRGNSILIDYFVTGFLDMGVSNLHSIDLEDELDKLQSFYSLYGFY